MEKENETTGAAEQVKELPAAEAGALPDLGKFRSVEALLHAYNSLEAEFTRRSQRLRELEGKGAGENALPAAPAPAADAGISLEERVERAVERCLAAREAPYVMAGGRSYAAEP